MAEPDADAADLHPIGVVREAEEKPQEQALIGAQHIVRGRGQRVAGCRLRLVIGRIRGQRRIAIRVSRFTEVRVCDEALRTVCNQIVYRYTFDLDSPTIKLGRNC